VSVAVADYAEFSDWFRHGPNDSMQVLNYVLPRDLETARPALARTIPMLEQFTRLFGSIRSSPRSTVTRSSESAGDGAQTMTSTTTFEEDVIAHELAHQWFGTDHVRQLQELWLNEGFATYSEALFREAVYGVDSYREHIASRWRPRCRPGTLYVQDTSRVSELFRYSRVYAKGVCASHAPARPRRQHVLPVHQAYSQDHRFRYGVATTSISGVCEDVSGLSLGPSSISGSSGRAFPSIRGPRVVREGETYLTTVAVPGGVRAAATVLHHAVDILLTDGVSRQTIVAVMPLTGRNSRPGPRGPPRSCH